MKRYYYILTSKGMNRRLAVYRLNSNKDKGDNTVIDFFK